ncbi:arginyltransferase [Algimonas porphyrae]|uniref:Aspartate/glutamate leucyltransferase n=1 Tax=Algimonas porphyrae TaxID=1128113 RepID=A0ABQ5UWQ9_9PROT|nr:arginyltransferase [Algimonas porphyrae]GLQ19142.1 putative arginyl-tRNA--protein transferase [Algimonas porphyrae]
MSHPFDPNQLQFFLTIPSPCPYLPGRMERKIFTQLDPLDGPHLNNYLTHAGFRRSQNVIYRPACETCRECRSLRVRAADFEPSRSFRRTLRRNADLDPALTPAIATQEQYDLLSRYLAHRHPGGGMTGMDFTRYEMMVEECASETEIVEYRNSKGVLTACMLIDRLNDGLSLVYSFFAPEALDRSLGNFMILDQISRCQMEDLPYLYLGYWVPGSPKMDYKARFQPAEILGHRGWIGVDAA